MRWAVLAEFRKRDGTLIQRIHYTDLTARRALKLYRELRVIGKQFPEYSISRGSYNG